MDLGSALRSTRYQAGLTQREVAAGASTSQTAVAAYENGRKSPNLATLARLAGAMGTALSIDFAFPAGDEHAERPSELLSQQERRSLWLHRAVVSRIQAEPERAIEVARENLSVRRRAERAGRAETWRRSWEDLLDGPLEVLLATLCSTSTHGSQLRQTAPFAGLLTARERWAVYRSFAQAEARAAPWSGVPGPERPLGAG